MQRLLTLLSLNPLLDVLGLTLGGGESYGIAGHIALDVALLEAGLDVAPLEASLDAYLLECVLDVALPLDVL